MTKKIEAALKWADDPDGTGKTCMDCLASDHGMVLAKALRSALKKAERFDRLAKQAKITRLYVGHGRNRRFDTCAWRMIVRCKGDWHGLGRAIDSARDAEGRKK